MSALPRPEPDAAGFALEGVSFAIDGRTVLHPLSARINGGEVVGLVGPNGSGKSTLVKLLARQLVSSGGTIRFAGRPLASWGRRDLARRIAYLPQHPQAGTGLTAERLAALGRYPWHGPFGRFSALDAAKTADAMATTGTKAFAARDVDALSGGERQRVWIAMLVAQDADCLLLDEPTAALDVAHAIEVLALVRRLSRERGRAAVVVVHDINMASRFCDRVLALRAGRLVADEPVAGFMTPECLHRVFDIAMDVVPHAAHPAGFAVPR